MGLSGHLAECQNVWSLLLPRSFQREVLKEPSIEQIDMEACREMDGAAWPKDRRIFLVRLKFVRDQGYNFQHIYFFLLGEA